MVKYIMVNAWYYHGKIGVYIYCDKLLQYKGQRGTRTGKICRYKIALTGVNTAEEWQ